MAHGYGVLVCLFVSAIPVAGACSLAEVPADPARIWLWDFVDDRVVGEFILSARELGGDCGLIVAHDVDGGQVAFVDRRDGREGVWVAPVNGSTEPVLAFETEGRYGDVDLDKGHLYVVVTNEQALVFKVRLDDKTFTPVVLPFDGEPRIDDGLVYWEWRDSPAPDAVNVYDLDAGQWIIENQTFADAFGIEGRARLVAVGAQWILISSGPPRALIHHAFNRESGGLWTVPFDFGYRTGLDGNHLVRADYAAAERIDLRTNEATPLAAPRPFTSSGIAVDGRFVVLGAYSASPEAIAEWNANHPVVGPASSHPPSDVDPTTEGAGGVGAGALGMAALCLLGLGARARLTNASSAFGVPFTPQASGSGIREGSHSTAVE